MRKPVVAVSFITLLTVSATAMPVAASPDSFSLESPALSPESRPEAAKNLTLKSPSLSVGLSLGAPLAVSAMGTSLMALGGYPTSVNALGILGMAVGAASPLALGTGQAYAGDPQRGLWVGLGTYGAMVGGLALGLGVAYAAYPQAMSAGGQSAGFGFALIALPISSVVTVGYTIWALMDAHRTAVRTNETLQGSLP